MNWKLLLVAILILGCGGDNKDVAEEPCDRLEAAAVKQCFDHNKMLAVWNEQLLKQIDSLRSAAPPCIVIVHDTVWAIYGGVSETLYVDTLGLYSTEAEVCKVRGHTSHWLIIGDNVHTCKFCGRFFTIKTTTDTILVK